MSELTAFLDFLRGHPIPVFLALCLLPAVGCPVSPLLLLVGAVFLPMFGAYVAIAITACALIVNLSLSYYLAAGPARAVVVHILHRFGRKLPTAKGGNGVHLIVAVRMAPGIPYIIQNYLLGCLRCPFLPYLMLSMIISGSFCIVIMLGGGAIFTGKATWFCGVVAVLFGIMFLRKYFVNQNRSMSRG
jgi:uncharacterized membrane protein YdjX (TVP38/TMEM64 family)